MISFEKSKKLEHVSYDVRGPVVAEADRMARQGAEILKLNIGNPPPSALRRRRASSPL